MDVSTKGCLPYMYIDTYYFQEMMNMDMILNTNRLKKYKSMKQLRVYKRKRVKASPKKQGSTKNYLPRKVFPHKSCIGLCTW